MLIVFCFSRCGITMETNAYHQTASKQTSSSDEEDLLSFHDAVTVIQPQALGQ